MWRRFPRGIKVSSNDAKFNPRRGKAVGSGGLTVVSLLMLSGIGCTKGFSSNKAEALGARRAQGFIFKDDLKYRVWPVGR